MRINKGVEWAAHACAVLVPLWPDRGLSLAALAEFHDVPEPYMAKQMQALSRAGLVEQAYRDSLAEIDLATLSRSVAAQLGMEKVIQAGQWIGPRVRSRG